MFSNAEAMQALRELAVVAPVLSAVEVAERTAAILDRSSLATLDLADFLLERGHTGPALVHAMGRFSTEAAAEYMRTYGVAPLKRAKLVDHEWRRVNAYLEVDRPVLERAYAKAVGR